MKLIVGLGNPGKEYANTRHNTGWLALDYLAAGEAWQKSKQVKAEYVSKEFNAESLELFKPLTFMNNSGEAVVYAAKKHQLKPEDIIVIYDDADLPVGKIRIGYFKSAGGHNGIKSIIQHLGNADFLRIRIGIKPDANGQNIPADKLVLGRFKAEEKKLINEAVIKTSAAIADIVRQPLSKVLNEYN